MHLGYNRGAEVPHVVKGEVVRQQNVQRRLVEAVTVSVYAARVVRIIAVSVAGGCNTVRVEGAQHPPPNDVLDGGSGTIEQEAVGLVLVGLDHAIDWGRKKFVHMWMGDGEVGMTCRGEGEHSAGFDRLLEKAGEVIWDEPDRRVDP